MLVPGSGQNFFTAAFLLAVAAFVRGEKRPGNLGEASAVSVALNSQRTQCHNCPARQSDKAR
jgi:cation transport regulator ChaB